VGLRLNAIGDSDAASALARCEEDIARWEEAGPNPEDRRVAASAPRYYEVLADLYFKAGTLAYQQQRPREHVHHYLYFAGLRSVEELEQRGNPIETTNRDFYRMIDRVLGIVACFCPYDLRPRLAALHESRYHWPHDPKWTFQPGQREQPRLLHGYYRLEYMRAALETLTTGRVNVVRVQALIRELDSDDRHVGERVEASLCYWALMAVADRNAGFLDQTLAKLLELHRGEAQGGRYKSRNEGLMCMNAMFLARMAREQAMPVTVLSDYLPLAFIG